MTDQVLERIQTPYNDVTVVKRSSRIDLEVEGATYATYDEKRLLSGYSWDALTAGALLHPDVERRPLRILLLGLGGGTVTRQLRHVLPEADLVAVEIDGEVVRLARDHMHLDDQQVKVHVGDALAFIADGAAKDTFDVILDDLYLTGDDDVMRPAVPEGPYLEQLQRRLADGGLLLANVITDVGHEKVQHRVKQSLDDAFDVMGTVRPPKGLNEIVVGGPALLDEAAVHAFANRFTHDDDVKHWKRLQIRRGW